jgi:hypothetical protein
MTLYSIGNLPLKKCGKEIMNPKWKKKYLQFQQNDSIRIPATPC